MTNPKDPWGQRPDDSPTEHLGAPGASGAPPTNVFGGAAGGYGQGEWTPPPPDATRAFPSYDSQWGPYEGNPATADLGSPYQQQPPPQQGWGAPPPGYQQPNQPGYPGGEPPHYPGGEPPHHPGGEPPHYPGGEPPRKRNTGLWIGLGLAGVLLIAVLGVLAGLVFAGGGDEDTAAPNAAATTSARAPRTTGEPSAAPTALPSLPPLPTEIPGLPGIEDLGSAMGQITANDGGTLTISTLDGSSVTVRTDANTQVISLGIADVADLPVGEMVVVQGEKGSDGAILAEIIISTGLSGGGR